MYIIAVAHFSLITALAWAGMIILTIKNFNAQVEKPRVILTCLLPVSSVLLWIYYLVGNSFGCAMLSGAIATFFNMALVFLTIVNTIYFICKLLFKS